MDAEGDARRWHLLGPLPLASPDMMDALADLPNLASVQSVSKAEEIEVLNQACVAAGRLSPLPVWILIRSGAALPSANPASVIPSGVSIGQDDRDSGAHGDGANVTTAAGGDLRGAEPWEAVALAAQVREGCGRLRLAGVVAAGGASSPGREAEAAFRAAVAARDFILETLGPMPDCDGSVGGSGGSEKEPAEGEGGGEEDGRCRIGEAFDLLDSSPSTGRELGKGGLGLAMGRSGSWRRAIELGASQVAVGTRIFGPRAFAFDWAAAAASQMPPPPVAPQASPNLPAPPPLAPGVADGQRPFLPDAATGSAAEAATKEEDPPSAAPSESVPTVSVRDSAVDPEHFSSE